MNFIAKGIYRQFSWQHEMIDIMKQRNFPQDMVFENPCIFQCLGVFKPKLLKGFLDEFIRKETKMFIAVRRTSRRQRSYTAPLPITFKYPNEMLTSPSPIGGRKLKRMQVRSM